jgi:uncharacterized protein YecA (UPF0149 family)
MREIDNDRQRIDVQPEVLPPPVPEIFFSEKMVDKIPTHFDNGTYAPITKVRARPKIGRNDMCSCESGKKNKKCCNTK